MSYLPHRDQPDFTRLDRATWDRLSAIGERYENEAVKDYHDHEECGCTDPACTLGEFYRPSAAEVLAYALRDGLLKLDGTDGGEG